MTLPLGLSLEELKSEYNELSSKQTHIHCYLLLIVDYDAENYRKFVALTYLYERLWTGSVC